MWLPRAWPEGLAPDAVCLTVDVEWAHPLVLADLVALIEGHGVSATFFVTHEGVSVPGHERGLHPNFRRGGDSYRALLAARGSDAGEPGEEEVHRAVLERTLAFAPEAKGLRTHSLYADSTLVPWLARLGLEYDCTPRLALFPGLRPVWQQDGVLAIPTYYADHFDLMTGATGFRVSGLGLDRPGVKVFDFHPNLVYLNAASDPEYQASRPWYHDPERLRAARHPGRGIRTLLIELLEHVKGRGIQTVTAGELNAAWRTLPPSWT